MNDFLPALSLRAILYYLNTWNNLVSRVLSYSAPAEREKILATRLRLEQATISGKSRYLFGPENKHSYQSLS